MRSLSIKKTLQLASIALFIAASLGGIVTVSMLSAIQDYGNVIDYSGRQRALSQRTAKMAYHLAMRGDPAIAAAQEQHIARMDSVVKALQNGDVEKGLPKVDDPEFQKLIGDIKTHWEAQKIAMAKAKPDDPAALQALLDSSEAVVERAQQATACLVTMVAAKAKAIVIAQVAVSVCILLFIVGLAVIFHRRVIGPIGRLSQVCDDLANGRLSSRYPVLKSQDEVALIGQHVNMIGERLEKIMHRITTVIDHVASSGEEISSAARMVTENAQMQTSQAQISAAAMDSLSQTIESTSSAAARASSCATDTSTRIAAAQQAAAITASSMKNTNQATETLADSIGEMKASIDKITRVIDVVKEVAEQTNLLALNAAIEAARAGEQGRGFAVVADEVRKLASKTASATSEIVQTISTMQNGIASTVSTMGEVGAAVRAAYESLEQSASEFHAVCSETANITEQIEQISFAMEEQNAVSGELNSGIAQTSAAASGMEEQTESIFRMLDTLTASINELTALANEFSFGEGSTRSH